MNEASPGKRVQPEEPPRTAVRGGSRPLYVTGLIGALWSIGIGLAVLTTITLLGWIAAPRTALGPGLPGVFRTAVNLWLVSHHAGFTVSHGRVGFLPLGLLVLPGALLYRSGAWMVRAAGVPGRPRVGVVHVAAALAVPYAILAGGLALAAATPAVRPSAWQALLACFVVALAAGVLGAARALVAARGRRVRSGLGALLRLLPGRPRSLVVGVAGATAVLLGSGAVLVGASLALHVPQATRLYDTLAPGIVGGILLLLLELAFLPNAVIWGMAYAIGPGFSVGAGTGVSPSGVFLDFVPTFPPLAALPESGPAPLVSLVSLAAPFLAGAVGGVLTIRALPSPVNEGAPLWGFLSGALTGAVAALLSALAGGPLGGGRLATVGPSAWQVGLLATLEVGVAAALAAWLANTRALRRAAASERAASERAAAGHAAPEDGTAGHPAPEPAPSSPSAGRSGRAGRTRRRRSVPPPETAAPPAPREPAVPLAAPVPAPPPPVRKPAPYTDDPLEFEEAEPVLAPRRPPARPRGRPEPPPAPPADPAHRAEPDWDVEPEAAVDHPEPEPDLDLGPVPPDVPAPREDRTETRGGAIYVLKEDPYQD
ncbi:hypothetical protein GCM10023085_75530 [Actinomadura viridis]|uniref:Integral membrane protein n=1 Tax=Actinomadura viridis TaxID=58110 RepID=A0A931DDF4_9ACTN|nr:DUF6350 family protein [Actinomadura viridis]MBG6086563.1 hypothetical protein [Actinomadura viridis]